MIKMKMIALFLLLGINISCSEKINGPIGFVFPESISGETTQQDYMYVQNASCLNNALPYVLMVIDTFSFDTSLFSHELSFLFYEEGMPMKFEGEEDIITHRKYGKSFILTCFHNYKGGAVVLIYDEGELVYRKNWDARFFVKGERKGNIFNDFLKTPRKVNN